MPNITPHADGIGSWSAPDIAEFLKSGLTPDFDSAGGKHGRGDSKLPGSTDGDRTAMATYIKALPPRAGKPPQRAP